jgi:hypothetical protein
MSATTVLDPEARGKIREEYIKVYLEAVVADGLYCIELYHVTSNSFQEKILAMSDEELLADVREWLCISACDPDSDCSGGCIAVDRLLDDPGLCDQDDPYVARSKSLVMLLSEVEGRT